MGFLAASASVCYFQVVGTFNLNQQLPEILQQLRSEGFRSIEQSSEELSTGWVELDDYESSGFASEQSCRRDQQLCFSLRQDRRRIPVALLKRQVALLSEKYLAENPNYTRVPKAEREQIRDTARSLLLARSLPAPTCYDIVWNTEQQLLRFCTLNQKAIDSFQGLFHQTFPGLRLHLLHPMARAERLLEDELQTKLKQSDQSQTDSALEQVEANLWLGSDFLRWMMYRTLNSDSQYSICCPGPLLEKQSFSAYLDNRLVLSGGGQEGAQKITVAGPQDRFSEVHTALAQQKQIDEATLHLQLDEDLSWKLTLKADRFQFGSFRTPMIPAETDPEDDPAIAAEAAFFTKLGAVEEGEQMFNSLLRAFLRLRLSEGWADEANAIDAWLAE